MLLWTGFEIPEAALLFGCLGRQKAPEKKKLTNGYDCFGEQYGRYFDQIEIRNDSKAVWISSVTVHHKHRFCSYEWQKRHLSCGYGRCGAVSLQTGARNNYELSLYLRTCSHSGQTGATSPDINPHYPINYNRIKSDTEELTSMDYGYVLQVRASLIWNSGCWSSSTSQIVIVPSSSIFVAYGPGEKSKSESKLIYYPTFLSRGDVGS